MWYLFIFKSGLMNARSLLFWLASIFLLALSNPSHQEHRAEIREQVNAQNPIVGPLGWGRAYAGATRYEDYKVFSITRLHREVTSLGVLGMVFVVDVDLPLDDAEPVSLVSDEE